MFFTKNPNLKKNMFFGWEGEGGVGGARVNEFLLLRIQI